MHALRSHEWRPGKGHNPMYVIPGHSPLTNEPIDRQADELADLLNRVAQPALGPLDDFEIMLCHVMAGQIADDRGWYERRVAAPLAAATAPVYVQLGRRVAVDVGSWPVAETRPPGDPVPPTASVVAALRRAVADLTTGLAKPVAVGFANAAAATAEVASHNVRIRVLDPPLATDDQRLVEIRAFADRLADAIQGAGNVAPVRSVLTAAAAAVVLVEYQARDGDAA